MSIPLTHPQGYRAVKTWGTRDIKTYLSLYAHEKISAQTD